MAVVAIERSRVVEIMPRHDRKINRQRTNELSSIFNNLVTVQIRSSTLNLVIDRSTSSRHDRTTNSTLDNSIARPSSRSIRLLCTNFRRGNNDQFESLHMQNHQVQLLPTCSSQRWKIDTSCMSNATRMLYHQFRTWNARIQL